MNKQERIEVVKAMDTLARCVNDEEVFGYWLSYGVADGDIAYGYAEDYIEDENLSELFGTFLKLMNYAKKSGGLYTDGVTDNIDN